MNLKIIDAKGKIVFPGGIDPHVHMHLPTPAGFSSDDFYSGSKAALAGGTTTLIDFVTPKRGQSIIEALTQRKKEAENCLTDYKFHVSPVEWTRNTEKEILQCIENEGVNSFKVYMAYKDAIGLEDDEIINVMKTVGKAGRMVTVHAELGDEIETLRSKFINEGKFTPEFHPKSRPAKLEALAVKKAIEMAEKANCPLYIVHVSAKESVDYIRKAQLKGQKVFAETCMHYLLLNDSKYNGPFEQTAPYVLSPPLRKTEDQEALWQALADGTIQTIGTDHCPFTLSQKKTGLNDFRKIPNGAGSVEHRLSLLYTYGLLQNKINFERFIDLTSTNAANIFKLSGKKGKIEVGFDADLLIWNPEIERMISAETHQMNCDNDIFAGFEVKGAPEYVIRRGKIVYSGTSEFQNEPQPGKFVRSVYAKVHKNH
ncbi:MAG: dihydropyrimidinase [Chloroflexia bacterium]|nr:dihydropyrimidinase [Chloroflexia bacterium]